MSENSIIIYDKTYNLQQKIHDSKFNFSATFKEISNTSDFDRFFLTPSTYSSWSVWEDKYPIL